MELWRGGGVPQDGAEEETRTLTLAMSTAPSTLRVYQFHHLGKEGWKLWQGWQDSNPRPTVLETVALPN